MCKVCKLLVISNQLGNGQSDAIRTTITAHNAGKLCRSEVKFFDGTQKGLGDFLTQQKPPLIALDDTGGKTKKLVGKIKQFAKNAIIVHVGFNEVPGVGAIQHQFENWKFDIEKLEPLQVQQDARVLEAVN